MLPRLPLVACVVALLLGATSAAAQQDPRRPPNTTRGLFGGPTTHDPNRTSQRLESGVDLGAGYDSNLLSTVPIDDFTEDPSGLASTGSAWIRFWRGRTARYFQIAGNTYVNHHNRAANEFIGGQASLEGTTPLGRRSSLSASAGASYDPVDFIEALLNPTDIAEGADGVPTAPIATADQRILGLFGVVEFNRQWTPRQSLEVQYSHGRHEAIGGWGVQTNSHRALISHAWSARPSVRLRGQYRYDVTLQSQSALIEQLPTVHAHTSELALEYGRRLSPSRAMQFTARGGTTYVQGTDLSSLLPVGGVSFSIDAARNWQIVTNAERTAAVLAGVTTELFVSNQLSLNLNGLVGSALSLGVGSSYAQGSGFSQDARFDAISGSANVQYRVARCCSVFTSYGYYRHNLRNQTPSAGPAVPPFFDNHSARVGFNVWLPLYGLF